MSKDKYKGKGGSYVRLPDGTRVTATEAAKRAEKKAVVEVAPKPVEKKDGDK